MGDWADNALRYARIGNYGKTNHAPTVVTCRHCGVGDLRWGQKKGGYWEVRTKDGAAHICDTD